MRVLSSPNNSDGSINQSIKVYFSKQPLGIFQSRKASRATDKFLHNKLSGNKNNRGCTSTAQRDAGERLARHHTAKQPDTCSQYRLGPRQHTRTPKQPQTSHCPRAGPQNADSICLWEPKIIMNKQPSWLLTYLILSKTKENGLDQCCTVFVHICISICTKSPYLYTAACGSDKISIQRVHSAHIFRLRMLSRCVA